MSVKVRGSEEIKVHKLLDYFCFSEKQKDHFIHVLKNFIFLRVTSKEIKRDIKGKKS